MRILNLMGKALVVAVLVPMVVGGCDELQKEVRTLRIQNRTLGEQLIDKDGQIVALQERNRSLEAKIKDFDVLMGAKNDQIQTLKDENVALRADLVKRDAHISDLISKLAERPTGGGGIPKHIQNLLLALQESYPEFFVYDQANGQLRFSSDITFASGEDIVQPKAQEVLTKLAAILNQEEARPILIAIVGHTDNTRVRKQRTKMLHKDNQGLSEHRAEAVQ
ncbi:MAG: OmpA family protein, partial [Anaerolineaceae bacterium]|nr:OmpA family protein [Anaerolineaceae bacterium]